MKKIISCLLILNYSSLAFAGNTPLPSDFFQDKWGKLEDTIIAKKLEKNIFEVKQHNNGKSIAGAGSILNHLVFCVASGLSHSHGFTGWSLSFKPNKVQNTKERYLTIVLLNSRKELKDYSSPNSRARYYSNNQFKKLCEKIVNPKHYW